MDFLPTQGSGYNRRTGAHFTVRSAHSAFYSLTYRPGFRMSRYQEEPESKDKHGVQTDTRVKNEGESVPRYQHRTDSRGNAQSLERELLSGQKMSLKQNQMRNSERQGRTELRRPNLSSRSKSLDWSTGAKSPERSYRVDSWASRPGEIRGADLEGSKVMSTVQVYTKAKASNDQDKILNRASRGQSLPSRMSHSVSLGPKGGQSILERIEKLYGSSHVGESNNPIKMTEQSYRKGSLGGTFPRRFSSGEKHGLNPGQSGSLPTWTTFKDTSASNTPGISSTRSASGQRQIIRGRLDEGRVYQSTMSDIGTRSLDRARSRHTVATQIRASRTAGEITTPSQPTPVLEGISEVSLGTGETGTKESEEKDWNNFSRKGLKERSLMKLEKAVDQKQEKGPQWIKIETSTDDVFESISEKIQLKQNLFNDKPSPPSAASVRNKINQFEALSQRTQASVPRRAFSVPAHFSKPYDGVQKSSSAKAIGAVKDRWEGLKEVKGEEAAATGTKMFASERDEKLEEGKAKMKELFVQRSLSVDETGLHKVRKGNENELQYSKYSEDFGKYSKLKTTLELPLNKDPSPRNPFNFYIDETDFSKIGSPEEVRMKDIYTSSGSLMPSPGAASPGEKKTSGSGASTPVNDDDKTPTNTPNCSPLLLPSTPFQTTTPIAHKENEIKSVVKEEEEEEAKTPVSNSSNISQPLTSNMPDLVSSDDTKGKKRVLDLNAWLAGLNPQIKTWGDDEDDDDDSTQKDEDSNYDSDSGESSVTITSNMSNKGFSLSLADLCNFAGVEYESENESDEWQSTGRRSVSLSSDVSGFSCVSVLPTEELDKLIEDVRSLGDNNLQDYEDVHVVVLHKDIGVGLGFSLAGGVDQNKPVTIHKVFHSGVAAQEGSIREGDQVLSINGTALGGHAHWEALKVLRRAKSREMGVVVLKKPPVCGMSNGSALTVNPGQTPTQVTEIGQRISMHLEKNNRDLGFSLQGGVGSNLGNKPLTVQKIFQGGPFEKVVPGDEMLEIDGVSLVGMRRLEAWTLIRRLPPGPVKVVLRRPPQPHKT